MKTALILVVALGVLVASVSAGSILQALGKVEQQDIAKERVRVSRSISHHEENVRERSWVVRVLGHHVVTQ